jgi:hypothetical protein
MMLGFECTAANTRTRGSVVLFLMYCYHFSVPIHPLQCALYIIFHYFSGNIVEYTLNNISTHHTFYKNKLDFTFKVYGALSNVRLGIFLMANNPNIMSGDMYYITLMERNYYDLYYELRKCASPYRYSGYSTSIPGETGARVGCKRMRDGVSTS